MIVLLKYWRVLSLLAILAGLGASHFVAFNKGIEAERSRNTNRVMEIRNDQNTIRNLRPDDAELLNRLRRGKF